MYLYYTDYIYFQYEHICMYMYILNASAIYGVQN